VTAQAWLPAFLQQEASSEACYCSCSCCLRCFFCVCSIANLCVTN
jgi:hypothetical protein